jgi:site-specific DNA-methyltransferase (adenine-specific)
LFDLMDSLYRILGPSEMMAYLLMMAPRLLELHRKLKPTGSLYLHCDPSASHYLKIILDVVFRPENFRNEVIWQRTLAKALVTKRLPRNHDVILNYTKTDEAKWNAHAVFTKYDEGDLDEKTAGKYAHRDSEGRLYQLDNLINPNPNRPNLTYEFLGVTRVWRWTRDRMQKAYEAGLVIQPKPGGVPRYKRYLDEQRGRPLGDIWSDIPPINSQAKERRGYPTQKPLALLERIIAASTDEGDVVLDPFAGCGTSIVAAERMNRKWIGIDITYLAINEVVARLTEEKAEGRDLKYELLGTPKDEAAAKALFENSKAQNHKPFEQWAVTLVDGKYNDKKGADRGIDGRIQLWDMKGNYREGVIQVKGGNALNLSNVRDFAHVIETSKAVFGIMISQKEPTKEMKLVAEGMGYADWPGSKKIPRYQILTTEGILERKETAIVPDGYRIGPDRGVGKAVKGQTETLFDE